MDHASFAAGLLGGAAPVGISDPARFAIYRNNVHVGLLAALSARFPVTEAVLGPAFFREAARAFLRQSPPLTPVLADWGEDFPDHLSHLAEVPAYVPDLARLEAAWTRAYHAADAAPLTLEGLASLDLDRGMALHPAAQVLASAWPVGRIWAAHQGNTAQERFSGADAVLVTRPALAVGVHILPPADLAFLAALQRGQSLADAVPDDPGFDFGRALIGLTALGAFAQGPHLQGDPR
ncbi:HvfC/BufC N-terminal domain-containing protein [Stagnihabitans tardus]|uniref:DUF2063 domain-containing protein n=1 Tax=Stagnihabitans tardus TaxID=2699202 RepID=A0AAE4Y5X3_9RHOB|nr:putative DNA-binding domain-containing protein [Stagnihabitans tardus]NBZ86352.1 DUF2063 domain-containing protein [Stagnihabitans tardus]